VSLKERTTEGTVYRAVISLDLNVPMCSVRFEITLCGSLS